MLDSNVLLWWFSNDARLAPSLVQRLITEPELFVSVVTPWELWIKARAGKLALPPDLEAGFSGDAFTMLSPTVDDARLAAGLPLLHRDPFDRMIVAQALNVGLTVVSSDGVFASYGVDVILV